MNMSNTANTKNKSYKKTERSTLEQLKLEVKAYQLDIAVDRQRELAATENIRWKHTVTKFQFNSKIGTYIKLRVCQKANQFYQTMT